MKRVIRFIPALLTSLALASAGSAASANGFVSLGATPVFSDPSCAPYATLAAVCAATGQDRTLIVTRYANGAWGRWGTLPGGTGGKPSCARIAPGSVLCGVRNGAFELVAYRFAGGVWSGPVRASSAPAFGSRASSLASPLSSDPTCAELAVGHALCAALDANGNVAAATFNGTAWTSLPTIVTVAYSPVSCTPDDRGHAICVWTTLLNQVQAVEFDGVKWLGQIDLGGRAFGPPACTDGDVHSGAVLCYYTGTDTEIYGNNFSGGAWSAAGWSGWGAAGGSLTSSSCAEDAADDGYAQYRCVATGVSDGTLWVYTAGQLWASLGGGGVIGTPSCVALDTLVYPGRVLCVAQTVANAAVSIILPGGP